MLARLLLAAASLWGGAVWAATPPAPTRWVTDSAGLLSAPAREQLDRELEGYEQKSGHQVLVWIGRTSAGVPIEDFAVRAFEAWKVGRRGQDDGLVLFVLADDRTLRIEVGYGLEGQVPDAIAARIIRETIVPRMRAGDPDGALRAGVAAIVAAIEGRPPPSEPPAVTPGARTRAPAAPAPFGLAQALLLGVLVLVFLFLLATNPSLALYLLGSVLSGGRHSGDIGAGPGGYSGRGGRSGGGGASGSW